MGYESSNERWSPVQSVEKILLSVISMLAGNYKQIVSFQLLFSYVLILIFLVQSQMTRVAQMLMPLKCGAKIVKDLIK